jgi:lipid II:glycine glycyltransferase (peptidoglycan interpeptide bridge formation enzyme)
MGGIELLDDFLTVYYKNMSRLGSPPQPKRFFKAFISQWKYGESIIFCAYKNDKPIGTCFLLSFGAIIENCWASTLFEYNKYFVSYLLYAEIINYSIRKGYKTFSFGRSSKDSGSLNFKKHWKPKIIQIYYNYSKMKPNSLNNLKSSVRLINLYKKFTPQKANVFLGSIISKYIY